jgi:hypothetical protein
MKANRVLAANSVFAKATLALQVRPPALFYGGHAVIKDFRFVSEVVLGPAR